MNSFFLPDSLSSRLKKETYLWLVSGAAGFIGSHLVEHLLLNQQKVVGLDNFFSGKPENLQKIRSRVGEQLYCNFSFAEGSIEDAKLCQEVCRGVDYVLHQAALGSVSRSIKDPKIYNDVNVTGFVNMLLAARDNNVKRFVYASSSSVYGDEPQLPKREEKIGRALSPYALSKYFNEKYAELISSLYGIKTVGLRYFNVFGPRQDPLGDYAAVIPKWIQLRLDGKKCTIFGDGTTSRDFCHISNVVQANLLAALSENIAGHEVFNVALGEKTSLKELYAMIDNAVDPSNTQDPAFAAFREGDIKHSLADISQIKEKLGYQPGVRIAQGLGMLIEEYKKERDI